MQRFLLGTGYLIAIALVTFYILSRTPDLWFYFAGYEPGSDPAWARAMLWAQWGPVLSYTAWLLIPTIFMACYYSNILPGLRHQKISARHTLTDLHVEGNHA